MSRIRLMAFAKVNYALDVLGLRGDDYHEVRTVMQSISLADEVEIERANAGFGMSHEPREADVGPQGQNTVYRAWDLLRNLTGEGLPVKVKLRKEIPAGAGLGGGSADAAAVLLGLNELFGLGLSLEELCEIGAKIGADVPFCLSGGTALGEGVGEVLTPLPAPPDHRLVVTKPLPGADTGSVYRAYDGAKTESARAVDPVVSALRSGSLPALAAAVANDLAPVTAEIVPEVAAIGRDLLDAGALAASMTGSGTAVYGIFDDEGRAEAAKRGSSQPFAGVYRLVFSGVEIV